MSEQKIKIKNIDINYKHFGDKAHTPNPSPRNERDRQEGKNIFLILHGWGGSSDSWIKVCDLLKENYEIYALDFPFFGKSDDLKEVWKVDDYVEMVEEFIENVIFPVKKSPLIPLCERGKLMVIAHSFGGRVAIKLASKNPEWLNKLYLCDAAGIKHPLTLKQKIAGIIARVGKKGKKHFQRRVKGPCATQINSNNTSDGTFTGRSGHLTRPIKFLYHIFGASDYYNCKNEIMRETFKNIIAEDLTPYLSEIKIPTTIIWGNKDKYTPLSDGKLMNKKIKNSELHIIKNAGHGIHLFAPDKLCEIIKKTLLR